MPPKEKRDPTNVLPLITWDSIRPPYPKYHYFEGGKDYPFNFLAHSFDMVNAWWLMEASVLAYTDETTVRKHLQDAPVTNAKFFNGPSTQCYVANNKDFAWVVFRGTEIRPRPGSEYDFRNIIADILADLFFPPVDFYGLGKVHQGFKQAFEEVWGDLFVYLKEQESGGRSLWFTGHSLGAALAALAAGRYSSVGNVHGLYTFGSPMVGDSDFCQNFGPKARTYRFVNNLDIITQLPPFPPFQHVGELYFIDNHGIIGPNVNTPVSLQAIMSFLASMWNMVTNIAGLLLDHVPILYATHIWNNIP